MNTIRGKFEIDLELSFCIKYNLYPGIKSASFYEEDEPTEVEITGITFEGKKLPVELMDRIMKDYGSELEEQAFQDAADEEEHKLMEEADRKREDY
ncbi:hypothetical protein [Pseudoalteromonas sp.]|uniref:hypothetical protein n=1 Tax=Pseudoalteromonas sp. TaxID=53249 RepID=UPI0026397A48|nr:hypothetical protein [Pseudoalteromonas sp.]MCP4585367.1 hypothetical protein [Pseudoalteromonas sp.]